MPDKENAVKQMREICRRLNEAAAAYYSGKAELMTDFEWDAMFDLLKSLEEKTGIVLPESPVHNVGSDAPSGAKELHEFPALSLAKTKSVQEASKWSMEHPPVWVSWKLDGLTLVVTYDEGRLAKVVTRGDGSAGQNITHLAKAISGIPQTVPVKGHLVVRGEAVISYADFNAFLETSGEFYANPRNLASGSLSLKDPEILKERKIRWIAFTLVYSDEAPQSWGGRMDFLQNAGFDTVERELVEMPSVAGLQAAIDRWTEKVTKGENPYPVDGLVIAYDDTVYAASGSVTGHHAVRAGLAFKWQDEVAETELDHIEWSCAVSSITPVAVFKPVALEGTTVRRASLCNISECERLGIGGSGTKLGVIKANKIIPKVVEVIKAEGGFAPPSSCPVCHARTEVAVSQGGAKTLVCTNSACPAKELRKFIRFVSKRCMDIDGISGETLAVFVNKGFIKTCADIYRLGMYKAQIAGLDGFGEKSAANICNAVESARKRGAVQFLNALSIPLCGPDVAKRLLEKYSLRELIDLASNPGGDLFSPGEDCFADIEGIGPQKSSAFVKWFRNPVNLALVRDIMGEVEIADPPKPVAGGSCSGLVFVITGDLHSYSNRDELKKFIESQGGKTAGSVSGATSFLITNDTGSGSSKNIKAAKLGIPIISEDEFIARFGVKESSAQTDLF